MSQSAIGPRTPQVIAHATGLMKYLRDVVSSSRRVVRDSAKFEDVAWLSAFPEELVLVPEAGPGASDSARVISIPYEPKLPAPRVPRILEGRLDAAAIHDPFGAEPGLRPPSAVSGDEVERAGESEPAAPEERSFSQQVRAAYEAWLGDWRAWSHRRREAEPRQRSYERLARIAHAVSEHDDAFESVLAVGLLVWEPQQGKRIHRHLVTRRVRISIDGTSARIEVRLDQDAALQLEDQHFLNEEDGYRRERAASLHERISECPQNPLHEDVGELVHDWSRLVFDEAVRYDAGWRRPDAVPSDAGLRQITLAPAVILRVRDRTAVVEVYERAIARLSGDDAEVPLNLAHLIAPLTADERSAWSSGRQGRWSAALEQEPLFPLPTNPRQREVLDLLRHNTAAVVQGPPGTGKTHTIANLTSALLAQGLRVLVTSQKEQALSVLRNQVPEQVRDLCVMLGSGERSNALERTLTALSDRAASAHTQNFDAMIRELADRRMQLLRRRAELEDEVQSAREAEALVYEPAPGYEGTLAVITHLVAADAERCGWVPKPPHDAPPDFPLGVGLFCQLRDLLRTSTPGREQRARQWFPDPSTVLSPGAFADLVASAERNQPGGAELSPAGEAAAGLSLSTLTEIEGLVRECGNCLHRLGLGAQAKGWRGGDWRTRALGDVLAKRSARSWEQIAASGTDARTSLDALHGLESVDISRLQPEEYAESLRQARVWIEHLRSGGRSRRVFKSAAERQVAPLLNKIAIRGVAPASVEDLQAAITKLDAGATAHRIDGLWRAVRVSPESTPLAERLEHHAERADALDEVREFGRLRDEIDRVLLSNGVRILLRSETDWDAFHTSLTAARLRIQYDADVGALEDLAAALTAHDTETPAPEIEGLRRAVLERDTAAYTLAHVVFSAVLRERTEAAQAQALLDRLRAAHRDLARLLADDPDQACWDDPTEVERAWRWAVASRFAEHARATNQARDLDGELHVTEQRLLDVTADLAGAKGWQHCLDRLDQRQRQSLAQLRSHLRAVGSGEGRYAGRARAAVRQAMATARDAVPAWIMPLHQVLESLPAEPDSFDVVIVDEASQVGLDGLFLLWLAPRVIVVGDDKQCVPGYGGGEYQRLFDRIDEYLPGTALADRHMFRPTMNLYELLSSRFPDVVRLLEHFRSMPEIIGWSSEQFYDRTLVPLRRFGADRLEPLRVVHVQGAYPVGRGEAIHNPVEAKEIVEKLAELVADDRYEDRTFGVITLQGGEQSRRIGQLIAQTLTPPVIEQHRIRVGRPSDFQGDERDVVLLSMVAVKPAKILRGHNDQRRFNVAASRARDQMWLFTSVAADRLKSEDLRSSLLAYMHAPPATVALRPPADLAEVSAEIAHPAFDSLFEQRVYLRIRERGYAVLPQVPAGAKKIDLVVYGEHGQLAVECDGDYWHGTPEQRRADVRRERELIRAGWRFWRIRESDFTYDPGASLTSLWTTLTANGIEPGTRLPARKADIAPGEAWSPIELPAVDEDDETAEYEEEDAAS